MFVLREQVNGKAGFSSKMNIIKILHFHNHSNYRFPHKLTCKLELRLPTQSCAQWVGGQALVSARVLVPARAADRQVASVQPVVRTRGEIQVCAVLPPPSRGKNQVMLIIESATMCHTTFVIPGTD